MSQCPFNFKQSIQRRNVLDFSITPKMISLLWENPISCGSRGAGTPTAYHSLKLFSEVFVNQSVHKWVDGGTEQY